MGGIPQMVSARFVAARLRWHRLRVYEACRQGLFPGAWRDGDTWKIPETGVLAYLDREEARTQLDFQFHNAQRV
jgi:hypothetical protein